MNDLPWIEKYRPYYIRDLKQSPAIITLFENIVTSKNLTHYILYGPCGTGKTSAILAIGREIFKEFYKERIIEFNASDERGINAVRTKILYHAKKYVNETVSTDGSYIPGYKIIILDEADSMTDEAQDALRVIIEKYYNVTRFCFICNYISKITDAIKSRCTPIFFKQLDNTQIKNRLVDISTHENLQLDDSIYDTIIDISNGDMRKALAILQSMQYKFKFNHIKQIPLHDLETKYLKILPIISHTSTISTLDVYNVVGLLHTIETEKIINQLLQISHVPDIIILVKNIINNSIPVNNLISTLIKSITIHHPSIPLIIKRNIIIKMGECLYYLKVNSNEYIQLLDLFIYIKQQVNAVNS